MRYLNAAFLCVSVFVLGACGKHSNSSQPNQLARDVIKVNDMQVYDSMSQQFSKHPDPIVLKNLLNQALPIYGYELTTQNLNKFGNSLLKMSKASNGQITELELLEQIVESEQHRTMRVGR